MESFALLLCLNSYSLPLQCAAFCSTSNRLSVHFINHVVIDSILRSEHSFHVGQALPSCSESCALPFPSAFLALFCLQPKRQAVIFPIGCVLNLGGMFRSERQQRNGKLHFYVLEISYRQVDTFPKSWHCS